MAIVNGTSTIYVTAKSKFYYDIERTQRLNDAIAELNREGKTIVNISDGPLDIMPYVGVVKCTITILWQVDTESDAHKAYLKECEERRAQQAANGSSSSGGCYIATCVYGSYNCPQVWTLRRYRDTTLSSTWYGRLFIRIYYAISPSVVKYLGHIKWLRGIWKQWLDKKVATLNSMGVDNSPYSDPK